VVVIDADSVEAFSRMDSWVETRLRRCSADSESIEGTQPLVEQRIGADVAPGEVMIGKVRVQTTDDQEDETRFGRLLPIPQRCCCFSWQIRMEVLYPVHAAGPNGILTYPWPPPTIWFKPPHPFKA
jgi:hypothetical protein